MRYYAHFGHTEFILCLGYGAQAVKDYFLNYRETTSNDFVLHQGRRATSSCSAPTSASGRITFVDTGIDTAIGERLRRVRPLPRRRRDLPRQLRRRAHRRTDERPGRRRSPRPTPSGSCWPCRPQDSFHVVDIGDGRPRHRASTPVADMAMRINGGYFVLAPGDLRLPRARATTWSWTPASGPPHDGRMLRHPVRRVLGADGHAQGARRARGAVAHRQVSVGRVAHRRRPPRAAGAGGDPPVPPLDVPDLNGRA